MRFNEKEMVSLSRQPSEMAAELGMRGPKKGDVVKRRLVKLVVNFLFYFRIDEEEPIGALLLEQCRVEKEDKQTFSIAFLDEAERKYVFECDSEDQCKEWIDAIIKARTLWSNTVYLMKLASKSAMVCRLCPENPPHCRLCKPCYSSLSHSSIYYFTGLKNHCLSVYTVLRCSVWFGDFCVLGSNYCRDRSF
uniref:Pleckstrin homology domain-containing family J member 1 n=1 Tax=Oryzias melastigma TaxID=30732 RepID=A0A3B3CNG4_ORYME